MRAVTLLLTVLLWSARVLAGEFPDGTFAVKSDLEKTFREARALESVGDPEAVERYRGLLSARGFPAPDALHWALARLTPPSEAESHWRAVLDARPRSPFAADALRGLREALARQGRLREAEAAARQLVDEARTDPERAAALASLLPLLDLQGKSEDLRREAKRLWVEFAASPEARSAEAYFAPAESLFDQIPPEDLLARGRRLMDRGSREEAARTLGELRRRLPEDSPLAAAVDLALGKTLVLLKRYDEANEPLRSARGDARYEEEVRYQAARALFGLNRGDEGAEDLAALARSRPRAPKAPDYLVQASRVFGGRRLWRQARRAENLLLRRYPRSAEAREALWGKGWAAFQDGRFAEAADRLWSSGQGSGRDWLRAQTLHWRGMSLRALGEEEAGRSALEELLSEFPLGYYARLTRAELAGRSLGPLIPDARRPKGEVRPLVPPLPAAEEFLRRETSERLERSEVYLRLGLPAAAREVLRGANGGMRKASLLYWAEDFQGALAASGRTWLDWPGDADPDPLDATGMAYPIAYPRSTSGAAAEAGIHPHLVLAIAHTESHFDPRAYSAAEARGLMQFIPSTGAAVAKAASVRNFTVDRLYEPEVALRLGARHLRELLDRFGGDTVSAVAAYNAGAGAVDKWRKERGGLEPAAFVESIPFKETRRYVKKVLTALDAYARLDPPGLWGAEGGKE